MKPLENPLTLSAAGIDKKLSERAQKQTAGLQAGARE